MKRTISVLLAVVMLISMAFGASASVVSSGIRRINEQQFQDALELNARSGRVTVNGTAIKTMSDLESVQVAPGNEIRIPLTPNMFLRADGTPVGNDTDILTAAALRSGRITVRATTSGADVATVSLESTRSGSYISVQFSPTPTIQIRRFTYSIFLLEGGARRTSTRINVRGTMAAEVYDVDSMDDYMDISDGRVLRATTNVRSIELFLGEDVTITAPLRRNMRYAGIALKNEITSRDEAVFALNRSVGNVYRLQTINLKGTGGKVRLDTGGRAVFYVYNTNGAYLGTTRDELPFWTTYYVSSRKVDSLQMPRSS